MQTATVPSWVKWNRPVIFERMEPGLPTAEHLHFYPLKDLFRVVTDLTRVSASDIRSDRRARPVAKARFIAYWLMRHYSQKSFPQIGRFLADRDHTTIMYGVERVDVIAKRAGISSDLAPEVAALRLWRLDWPSKQSLARH
jgi:chromosomal replication initiation ATPase DnaA